MFQPDFFGRWERDCTESQWPAPSGFVWPRLSFEEGGWVYGNAVATRNAACRARLGRGGRITDIEPAEKKKHYRFILDKFSTEIQYPTSWP
jgi:hypothetical protein